MLDVSLMQMDALMRTLSEWDRFFNVEDTDTTLPLPDWDLSLF